MLAPLGASDILLPESFEDLLNVLRGKLAAAITDFEKDVLLVAGGLDDYRATLVRMPDGVIEEVAEHKTKQFAVRHDVERLVIDRPADLKPSLRSTLLKRLPTIGGKAQQVQWLPLKRQLTSIRPCQRQKVLHQRLHIAQSHRGIFG